METHPHRVSSGTGRAALDLPHEEVWLWRCGYAPTVWPWQRGCADPGNPQAPTNPFLFGRFEMPYNIWCDGCKNHIGMGELRPLPRPRPLSPTDPLTAGPLRDHPH